MDPHWLTKVKENAVDKIETELDINAQDALKIPNPLWQGLKAKNRLDANKKTTDTNN